MNRDEDTSDPDRTLDLALVSTDGLAVLAEDPLLAFDVLDAAADVVGVAIAGDKLQRHPFATAADQDREP